MSLSVSACEPLRMSAPILRNAFLFSGSLSFEPAAEIYLSISKS